MVAPEIEFAHGWAHILTNRKTSLVDLMRESQGGHILVIPDAPGWTYNLRPRAADLASAAERADVDLEAVDRLPDDAAVLYVVDSQKGQP